MGDAAHDKLPNPFVGSQRPNKEKTLKWCAWDVLKRKIRATEAEIAEEIVIQGHRSSANIQSVSARLRRTLGCPALTDQALDSLARK